MSTQQNNASSLRSEAVRLQSFQNWPVPHIVSPESLARAGFYYLQQDDKTKCVFCKGMVEMWEVGDEPDEEHKRHFPHCPFVQKVIQRRLNGLEPEEAENVDLRPNVSFDRYSQEELGINVHRGPHRSDYVTMESRLQSFSTWPKALVQTPQMLAGAGFYYLGRGDAVQCFSCGGAFKDWDPPDDPWTEHAKWFPKCNYVLLVKGQDFIRKCKNHVAENTSKDVQTSSESKESANNRLEMPSEQERSAIASNISDPSPSPETIPDDQINKLMKKSRLCKICMSTEIGVVFLPCGHLVVCVNCAPSLTDCPICRSPIKGTVRTFLS